MVRSNGFRNVIIAVFIIPVFSSCISRLSRPEITGVVVDYDKKPIANCKVGTVTTGKDGSFTLPELRYNQFLLAEIFATEAPPVFVSEEVTKEGYEPEQITMFNARGGAAAKGAKYKADTIFLKRNGQEFDVSRVLKGKNWELAYTKNADSVFMVVEHFSNFCKTERCELFYLQYSELTDNAYYTKIKNLPHGVLRRSIALNFDKGNTASVVQIQQYDQRIGDKGKQNDTLQASLKWKVLSKDLIHLESKGLPAISNNYKIARIDFHQLLLVRKKQEETL